MDEFLFYWHALIGGLSQDDGLMRFFVMIVPMFLLLEMPLNIMVVLGVCRWYARKISSTPKESFYHPTVSCVITCYSEGKDVEKTLLSLCEQVYPGHIEMIPVVDGATANDLTMSVVRNFKVDKFLYPKRHLRPIAKWQRGGRVSSLNAGLSLATGEIIMALDGDTSFDNNMVSAIVRHFEDPKVPAVSGSLRLRNAWKSMTTLVQAFEYLISIHMSKIGLAEWNVVNNISGAFGAFRRSFLEHIGGWDTHTAEDLDITLRIKNYFHRHKLRIPFEPEAIGHTDGPVTFKQFLMQRLRWDGDLHFLYFRKHPKSISPRLMGWPNFIMTIYTGIFFQIVLPFVIFFYMVLMMITLPLGASLVLLLAVYMLYVITTLILYLITLLAVSERPKQDLKLMIVIPVFPLFMFIVRCWSATSMLNDKFRRGHEETSMAPWWVIKRANRF